MVNEAVVCVEPEVVVATETEVSGEQGMASEEVLRYETEVVVCFEPKVGSVSKAVV
jgi:hypothetical protein